MTNHCPSSFKIGAMALLVLFGGACGSGDTVDASAFAQAQGAFSTVPYRGVNLASAEFAVDPWGYGKLPGTYKTDYIYPHPEEATGYYGVDYYLGKGMNTIRLPFRWERLQRTLNGAFDAAELGRLKKTVSYVTAKGAYVVLDPHNYARYGSGVIGSSAVPHAAFADFWSRLATEFGADSKVVFGLMNEPHDMATEQWVTAANTAIKAIRNAGASNLILVPGNAWSGAHSWSQNWYGTPNSQAMLGITDPSNHFAFEVHQYFDTDSSGTVHTCVSSTIGSQRVSGFTNWLKANGRKGFLGEFSGGSDATCTAATDDLLKHLSANADVWIGWTYWAGGPWWGQNVSLEPANGADKPQMLTLMGHLPSDASPPPPPPEPPPPSDSTCVAATYQAEAMTRTTGGLADYDTAVNLWGNGSVYTTHSFGAGTTTITVTARGQVAQNVWPVMEIWVGGSAGTGGTRIASVTVNSATYKDYTATFTSVAANQELRVAFTNDYYSPTTNEDRNLIVDKVSIGCGSTTPTASCSDGSKNGDETDVDCGGSCSADCADAKACVSNADCQSGNCSGSTNTCQPLSSPPPPASGVSAAIAVTSDWGSGYCADITVKNNTSARLSSWTVQARLDDVLRIDDIWGGRYGGTPPNLSFAPVRRASKLAAGASTVIGFCATRQAGGTAKPVVVATTSS